ncbi:hypothetical protein ANO11243_086820 [Dothideomycetidae sp. 11243]|nr:hypothetical protein ANO11243_086820 [fungal sp. No.11243]
MAARNEDPENEEIQGTDVKEVLTGADPPGCVVGGRTGSASSLLARWIRARSGDSWQSEGQQHLHTTSRAAVLPAAEDSPGQDLQDLLWAVLRTAQDLERRRACLRASKLSANELDEADADAM